MMDLLVAAGGRAFNHEMLDEMMPPGRDLRQCLLELLRLQSSQETQPPQIYAENGQLMKAHLMRGSQDRAVAAKDDCQFRLNSSEVRTKIQRDANDWQMPLDHRSQSIK